MSEYEETDSLTPKLPSAEKMMEAWDAFHNTLGGGAPGDKQAYAEMIRAKDVFTIAANDYCAELDEAMRALDLP